MGPQDMLMTMLGQQQQPTGPGAGMGMPQEQPGSSPISPMNLLFTLVGMGMNNLPRVINAFMDLSQVAKGNSQDQPGALATPPETAPQSPAMGSGAPVGMGAPGIPQAGPGGGPMEAMVQLALAQRAMRGQ